MLIAFIGSLGVVGLATAFLLGNLRDDRQAGIGLAIVLGSIVVVVSNIPGPQSAGDLIFIPFRFVVAWVAGYAMRERAEQAEAAEMRASELAEREREAAARVAVAEERTRIARELHDIVAHAMSVMVLQVGAVRHKLPDPLEEDREALGRVEQAGRTALAEMRRLLGAMRSNGDLSRSALNRASMPSTRSWKTSSMPGFRCNCTWTASPTPSRARSTSPPTESFRKA